MYGLKYIISITCTCYLRLHKKKKNISHVLLNLKENHLKKEIKIFYILNKC